MSLVDIKNHADTYRDRMASISHIKASLLLDAPRDALVLDYGCGAGDVAHAALELRPDLRIIGFDTDIRAIRAAQAAELPGTIFVHDETAAFRLMRTGDGPKVAFFASVLHEIGSVYGYDGTLRLLEKCRDFDQIAIRDMAHERGAETRPDVIPEQLRNTRWAHEFEAKWGPANTAERVAHLMLKARYTDNWNAELLENYFVHSKEDFIEIFGDAFPSLCRIRHETPEFLDAEFRSVYGRAPSTATHVEIVLEK